MRQLAGKYRAAKPADAADQSTDDGRTRKNYSPIEFAISECNSGQDRLVASWSRSAGGIGAKRSVGIERGQNVRSRGGGRESTDSDCRQLGRKNSDHFGL